MKTKATAIIASVVLAGASLAFAGDEKMGKSSDKMDHTMDQMSQSAKGSLANMNIDDLEGKDIVDSNGMQLGDIDEIVTDKRRGPMAVIGLKDSNKEVVVPLDKLSMSSDRKNLTTKLTREKLLAMPDYDPMDMSSMDK